MQDKYYLLYKFFDNEIVRWIRVAIFFCLGFAVYLNRDNPQFVINILPLYGFLLLQELFIHLKLSKIIPKTSVEKVDESIQECMDFKARTAFDRSKKVEDLIKSIENELYTKFLKKLLDITLNVQKTEITKDELLKKALETTKVIKGKYINPIDIYASYLLLLEEKEKTLFNNDLTVEDLLTALAFVRKDKMIDATQDKKPRFTGSGAFDFFVYGWNAEVSRYASNFTQEVLSQDHVIPIGRDREYDLLVTALSKNTSSNALIVGDAGIGKTALVTQFVIDSNDSKLPKNLSHKQVFKLYAERLIAGITNTGDLESRFIYLFEELMHTGNVIVYIPNIENIFGGGGANIDISGSIVEYLRSSRIKIIGSITPSSYQTFIYPKQELKELFDVVEIDEPDEETSLYMILEKAKELENENRIFFTFNALKEVSSLSDSYINDGTAMPGRAIKLMEDVISESLTHGRIKITQQEIREFVEKKTQIVLSKPTKEESKTLLNLEEEIHKKIVSQNEAVSAISDAMRRVRSGMKNEERPIASFLFLGPTGVGKTETAKALALSYFGDEKAMIRLDMSEYQKQDAVDRFLGTTVSEEYEETVVDKILENPFSMVLLDEFEKAHPQVLDLFLQIFDEGVLTDNRGRKISFKNTIIIATSNAGSEFIREKFKEGKSIVDVKSQLVDKVLQENSFKPELINRFDDVIIFNPLTNEDVIQIAKLFLSEVLEKIGEQQITVSYEQNVPEFIAQNSYSVEFGARNIRRFIQQAVENQLSKLLLSDTLKKGSNATISIENNSLVIKA